MDNAPNPLPSYLASLVRAGLVGVAGWLVRKGYATADTAPELIAGGLAAVTVIWSLIQKRNAHKALKSAIAAPGGVA